MTDRISYLDIYWQDFKNIIKFWFARLAIKWCGVEVIYWSSPLDWEEYMSQGEPVTPDVYYQSE